MKEISAIFDNLREILLDAVNTRSHKIRTLRLDEEILPPIRRFCQDLNELFQGISERYQHKFQEAIDALHLSAILSSLISNAQLSSLARALRILDHQQDWFLHSDLAATKANLDILKRVVDVRLLPDDAEILEHVSPLENADEEKETEEEEALLSPRADEDRVKVIADLIKAEYLRTREQRLILITTAFKQFIPSLPHDFMSYAIKDKNMVERFEELSQSLDETLRRREEKGDEAAFKKAEDEDCQHCEQILNILLIQLNQRLHHLLDEYAPQLSATLYQAYLKKINALTKLSQNMLNQSTLSVFTENLKDYEERYRSLFDIRSAPHLAEEKELREMELEATQHLNDQKESSQTSYRLPRQLFAKADNEHIVKHHRKEGHPDKIVLSGQAENNLKVLFDDYQRGLRIKGLSYKKTNDRAKDNGTKDEILHQNFKNMLEKELGVEHTASLIKHYSQGPSFFLTGPMVSSLTSQTKNISCFTPQDPDPNSPPNEKVNLDQQILLEDNMFYYDCKGDHIAINSPQTKTVWYYKTDFHLQGWFGTDGVHLEFFNTNDPLAAICLMKKNNSDLCLEMITLINKMEKELQKVLLDTESNIQSYYRISTVVSKDILPEDKKKVILLALAEIDAFKQGGLRLKELIDSLGARRQAISNAPYYSFLAQLCNENLVSLGPNSTSGLIGDLLKPLEGFYERLEKEAKPYLNALKEVEVKADPSNNLSNP